MLFYVGIHRPAHAGRFERCMVSINKIRGRRSAFPAREWMLDSGAFTEIKTHGEYRDPPAVYAEDIKRWHGVGRLVAAVSQDYMCEPFILARTGLTVREHQLRTIDRYDAIRRAAPDVPLLPVLQGFQPAEYARHVGDYAERLAFGAWVGVGSVCKRNSDARQIEDVLLAIHRERPDLRLHGFGIKLTALASDVVRTLLYSADSMAWSYSARMQGRDGNSMDEAEAYVERVAGQQWQREMFLPDGAALRREEDR